VPLYYFDKVYGLKGVKTAGFEYPDNKQIIQNSIFKTVDGESYISPLKELKKKSRGEYVKIKKYLINSDRTGYGYKVNQTKEGKTSFYIVDGNNKRIGREISNKDKAEKVLTNLTMSDPDSKYDIETVEEKAIFSLINPKGVEVGKYRTENLAWEAAKKSEYADLVKAGYSEQAAASVIAFRRITDGGFALLTKNMKELIAEYERKGEPVPDVVVHEGDDKVSINLKVALSRINDLRGSYFPRIRESGKWMVIGKKPGQHSYIEFFDSTTMANNLKSKLQDRGYTVSISASKNLPEDLFALAGQTIAIQEMVNKSLGTLEQEKKKKISDFGFTSEWINNDLIVKGVADHRQSQAFKSFDGKYNEEKTAWIFKNAKKNIDKRIVSELQSIDNTNPMNMLAAQLAGSLADVIRGRGARAAMISRKEDVWIGYEEDPLTAAVTYGNRLSGAQAKHIMAIKMIKAITGTEEDWTEYKKRVEAQGEIPRYEDYEELVNTRKIDPATQKNAWEDGMAYMKDMLRNDEQIDRTIGLIKNLAVLKYLSGRVSAPVINLTNMGVNVPAAMTGLGKIPMAKTFRLIGGAMADYTKYWTGKRESLSGETNNLFQEIENRGWHKAHFNREIMESLKGRFGNAYDTFMEWAMLPFDMTEQMNRAATIAAAYRGLRRQKISHEEALLKAKEISDKAHGVYGKINYPSWARGANVFAQGARSFYVFRTFSHNYLILMKELGVKEKDIKSMLYMAAMPAVLAGAGASIITALAAGAVGFFTDEDPEEEFYKWINESLGESAEGFARSGFFGLAGINLKGSLKIGITDIPTTIPELLGAPGSIIKDTFYTFPDQIIKGNYSKAAEAILPLFLANPIKGYREATEGITTRTNAPVFYGKDPLKLNVYEALLRFLSFNPARVSGIREKLWKERQVEQRYTNRRSDIYSRFSKYLLSPKKTKSQYIYLLSLVRQYNIDVRETKHPPITGKSLQMAIKRKLKPSKKERERND